MSSVRILLVGREIIQRAGSIPMPGWEFVGCDEPADVVAMLGCERVDMVVAAGALPALQWLRDLRSCWPALAPVVVVEDAGPDALIELVNDVQPAFILGPEWGAAELQGAIEAVVGNWCAGETLAERALDSLRSHIAVIDGDGRIESVNRAWVEFGTSQGLIPGTASPGVNYLEACRVDDDPDTQRIVSAIRELLAGERRSLDVDYPCHSPEQHRWFSLRGRRLVAGGQAHVVLEHIDVTQRLRALQAVQRASQEAHRSSELKSRFVAGVSHEIRTPLNAILGHTELLLRGPGVGDESRAGLQAIRRSGEHLLELIDGVLELSRADGEGAALHEVRFDPCDLVEDVEAVFADRAASRGLVLEVRCSRGTESPLVSDAGKLRQILFNLVDNAIKFSQRGQVRVSIDITPRRDGAWGLSIAVRDHGPGLDATSLHEIFEPFRSLPVGGRRAPGAGLGLAISREYARALGGSLSAQNHDDGAEFRLELTVSAAVAGSVAGPCSEPVALRAAGDGPRLLIVDDNEDNLVVLARMLEPVGFGVYPAGSGEEALDVWLDVRPDAVLVDLRMPGMDGWETTRRLLQQDPALVIIAISASVSEATRQRAEAAGARAFVGKPYGRAELLEVLGDCLDLEYEYEAPMVATPTADRGEPPGDPREGVAGLAGSLRRELYRAATAGDVDGLRTLIAEVRELNPALGGFLTDLVADFEMESIRCLVASPIET